MKKLTNNLGVLWVGDRRKDIWSTRTTCGT